MFRSVAWERRGGSRMVQSPSKAWAIITAEDGKVTIMMAIMMTIMVTFMRFQVTDSPRLILFFSRCWSAIQFSLHFWATRKKS